MDAFDYVIIALGIGLIAVGLFLFVSGKRDSANNNQVEGFGIKLNVSNPSIILIVFGIGMVLFPRLSPNINPSEPNADKSLQSPVNDAGGAAQNTSENTNIVPLNDPKYVPQNEVEQANIFFPQGLWYMSQYEVNGMNLTNTLNGNITYTSANAQRSQFSANLSSEDMWGNVTNYQYNGIIDAVSGGYTMQIMSSNDPSFVREGATSLILKMDNPNSLHMEYWYSGASIIFHWSK